MQAEKRIIWGFPGCGKSFFADGKRIVDADCRFFEFAGVNEELLHGGLGGLAERNLDYPGNYLEYVKTCSADVVLVNCHLGLLSEFPGVEIVYPAKELKGEYLDRYRKRGDDESFLSYMDEVFEQMVELIEGMEGVQKYRMEDPVMYLSDVMNKMDVLRKERGNDMEGKTYEIRRADMENYQEYSIWKHANEEVWEVCDENFFKGKDSLILTDVKRVREFDYDGEHFQVFCKENGTDLFSKEEFFEPLQEVCKVAYCRFSEEDIVQGPIMEKINNLHIIGGMDLSDAPSEVDLLEDAIQEKKMIEEIELYETAFRNACKDMIEMCYSKEKLHKILDEEWEQFKGIKYRPLDREDLYGKEQEISKKSGDDKKIVPSTSLPEGLEEIEDSAFKDSKKDSLDSKIQDAARVCEKMSEDKGVVGKGTEKEFGR